MKSIYMQGGFHNEETPAKICHEGRTTRGVLADDDTDKHLVGVKTPDGKVHWAHESLVSLDLPEQPLRRRR